MIFISNIMLFIKKTMNTQNYQQHADKYVEQYLQTNENINLFDPITTLTYCDDIFKINKNQIYCCYREPDCECLNADKCDCDSEEYVKVENCEFIINSSCRASLMIQLKSHLNTPSKYCTLRLFYFSSDNQESPYLDISRFHNEIIVYQNNTITKFKYYDKIHYSNSNIIVNFNYMDFL